MKQYFKVSYQHSETVYSTNIAFAENEKDVAAHYSKYAWFSIKPAADYEVETAKAKGMPIVACDHIEETAAAEPEEVEEPESVEEVNQNQKTAVVERVNALVSPFSWTKRQRAAVDELIDKACTGAASIVDAMNRLNDALIINYGVDLQQLQEAADRKKGKKQRPGYASKKILEKYIEAYDRALEAVKNGEETRVRISFENSKMGPVASASLLPLLTCPGSCMTTCGPSCYASKLANLRPAVLWSYAVNTALYVLKPEVFWTQVNAAISAVRYFRFNVSGDIRDAAFFRGVVKAAAEHPETNILVFTKKYRIVNEYVEENGGSRAAAIPSNLKILFSAWYGLDPINPYGFPETMVYCSEEEIVDAWLLCGGNCFECACRGVGCWQATTGQTIAFKKH